MSRRLTRALVLFVTLAVCLATSDVARANVPACVGLTPAQEALRVELFASLHPYDGCDETFARCLAAPAPAPVVVRLANSVCRKLAAGKSKSDIERGLVKRAQSMLQGPKRAHFTLKEATRAGDAQAPVQVVVYACARCPFCRVLIPALHREVTDGVLKGKARLYFQPFPIKDHPGAMEGGLAFLSAAALDGFWPLVLLIYDRYQQFSPAILPGWAAEAGLDAAQFERTFGDAATRAELVALKQEGIRNRVEATPTLFIDGRRYSYDLELAEVIDVLLEAHAAAVQEGTKP